MGYDRLAGVHQRLSICEIFRCLLLGTEIKIIFILLFMFFFLNLLKGLKD